MVEQNFRFAAPLADRFYVMEHGQIVEAFAASELNAKNACVDCAAGGVSRSCNLTSGIDPAHHLEEDYEIQNENNRDWRCAGALRPAPLCGLAQAQISGDVVKIGFITDMSGVYSDIDGQGGAEAIKMAIADFGGSVNGKKIELVTADHQNKADIAAAKAREWFDQQGVDMLIGGTNSGTNLSMAKVAAEKKKPFIAIGAGTAAPDQ